MALPFSPVGRAPSATESPARDDLKLRLTASFVPFDPPVEPGVLPACLPSPFGTGVPHPLAARAAGELMAALEGGWPLPRDAFEEPQRGKMFGVLVVSDAAGRLGYLKSFSGMLAGRWRLPGFAGPVFDEAARDGFWPEGEAALLADDRALEEARAVLTCAEAELAALQEAQRQEREALERVHAARKAARDAHRARDDAPDTRARLANESRADAAALRFLRASHRPAEHHLARRIAEARAQVVALQRQRQARSCSLLERLYAGYRLPSARGEVRDLRALFAPATPPGGSGDCAGPKLFVEAYRQGLRPVALAELWWGAPPLTGGRRHGAFYPSCRGKCGPVLAHLLDGLAVEAAPIFGASFVASEAPRVLFEDAQLMVVEKPVGLLSVPGRTAALQDTVETRLRARRPESPALSVVHRLDLETSGLLLVAKDLATRRHLQAQFSRRTVAKRYVAWVEGELTSERGSIDLALRVDLDDRPRQIHDPVHGKDAHTQWEVTARRDGRTRVLFYPQTGRTHQLRIHAAHPQGLGAPIVGDRLYGREDVRMLLHAERLQFEHPRTGETMSFELPAPF